MTLFLSPQQTKFRLGWLGIGMAFLPLILFFGGYYVMKTTDWSFSVGVVIRGWFAVTFFEPMSWVVYNIVTPLLLLKGARTVWSNPLPWSWGRRWWALAASRCVLLLACVIASVAFVVALHGCNS